ncbi:MAG: FAD-binding oxidoreductase [Mycobacteriales bacterium]
MGFPTQPPEQAASLPELPPDRVSPTLPARLRGLASSDPLARVRHGLGRAYRDLIRGIRGQPGVVPDVVLSPGSEAELAEALEFCSQRRFAVIPFGGGTSVVGGVEPALPGTWPGVVSLDLRRLSGLLEVDDVSRLARIGAGTTGPALERALADHRLTARFFPQSFERSTVGGWVATRAAGHFSTRLTHIDDSLAGLRAISPSGQWVTRTLPGDGAGPAPERLLLGSEGALAVISEVVLRVQPKPVHRHSATFAAADFLAAAAGVRALVQTGSLPATCRLIDPVEAAVTATLESGEAVLVLGFESFGPPVGQAAEHAEALLADHGLRLLQPDRLDPPGGRGRAGEAWRTSFLRAPYLREELVLLGVLVETFETAVPWARLDDLVSDVKAEVEGVLASECGGGRVSCRLTHVYPDGAAPYFTVLAPARRGSELDQWAAIKAAASEAVLRGGGTITHHHAVGREHVPWYERQVPAAFRSALAAAKASLDPAGICNPGVLGLPG